MSRGVETAADALENRLGGWLSWADPTGVTSPRAAVSRHRDGDAPALAATTAHEERVDRWGSSGNVDDFVLRRPNRSSSISGFGPAPVGVCVAVLVRRPSWRFLTCPCSDMVTTRFGAGLERAISIGRLVGPAQSDPRMNRARTEGPQRSCGDRRDDRRMDAPTPSPRRRRRTPGSPLGGRSALAASASIPRETNAQR